MSAESESLNNIPTAGEMLLTALASIGQEIERTLESFNNFDICRIRISAAKARTSTCTYSADVSFLAHFRDVVQESLAFSSLRRCQ